MRKICTWYIVIFDRWPRAYSRVTWSALRNPSPTCATALAADYALTAFATILAEKSAPEETVATSQVQDDLVLDLAAADAVVFGSPTYMDGPSWQFKKFADASSKPWFAGLERQDFCRLHQQREPQRRQARHADVLRHARCSAWWIVGQLGADAEQRQGFYTRAHQQPRSVTRRARPIPVGCRGCRDVVRRSGNWSPVRGTSRRCRRALEIGSSPLACGLSSSVTTIWLAACRIRRSLMAL